MLAPPAAKAIEEHFSSLLSEDGEDTDKDDEINDFTNES